MEPSRCCISSIALVLLKTGIVHYPSGERPVTIDYNQMATAQKLLLFWRKPAVGLTSRSFFLTHGVVRAAQMLVGWRGGGFGTTWGTHPAGQAMGKKGLDTRTQLGSCFSNLIWQRPCMLIVSRAGLIERQDTRSFFLSPHDHPSFHSFIIYTHPPCAAYFNDITHASILQCGSPRSNVAACFI